MFQPLVPVTKKQKPQKPKPKTHNKKNHTHTKKLKQMDQNLHFCIYKVSIMNKANHMPAVQD